MDRRATLLQGLDIAATQGLEFGPLHNPILRKPQARVLYVDHADTATLREKYATDPHVDPRLIVEVDIVWDGGPLDAACGHDRFDYVVASHVIEHVPDLIGWLAQLKSVLLPSGTVRLIVPDHRYCFDYRRQTSSAADVILAARAGARAPGAREILDFTLNIAPLALDDAWSGQPRFELPPARYEYDRAIGIMEHALTQGIYHDVHCWVFTPLSFARLMRQLAAYGLLGFACTQCTATEIGSLDFFVHLTASDDAVLIRDSWHWAVEQHAAPENAEIQALRREVAFMRGSWSWRLTRPLRRLRRMMPS